MRVRWLVVAAAALMSACGDDDAPAMDVDSGTVRMDGGAPTSDAGPGADGGPTTDAGGGGSDGGGMPADGGPSTGLTNTPAACAMTGYTTADVANAGHYAATRLTPPSTPYTVTSIYYTLAHDPGTCDADQAHQVLVFTGTGTMPPATPAGVTLAIAPPATPTTAGDARLVERRLDTPLVVAAGESLYVAVQMVRGTTPLCLYECLDPGTADRNWWSAGTTAPFPWRTLASYGNDGTLMIGARND